MDTPQKLPTDVVSPSSLHLEAHMMITKTTTTTMTTKTTKTKRKTTRMMMMMQTKVMTVSDIGGQRAGCGFSSNLPLHH